MNNFNLSEKFRSLPLKTKKIFAISSIVIFVFLTIFIALFLNYKKHEAIDKNHSNEDYGAVISHSYLFTYNFTSGAATAIRNNINEIVFNESERQSAPRDNQPSEDLDKSMYEAVINEESFITEKNLTKPTYSFILEVSDGRVYKAYLHSDTGGGVEYVVTVMYRTDLDNQKTYAFINTNNHQYEQLLQDWVLQIGVKNPSFIKDGLEVLEK